MKKRRKKPSGIRTHDLQIMRRVVNHCATSTAQKVTLVTVLGQQLLGHLDGGLVRGPRSGSGSVFLGGCQPDAVQNRRPDSVEHRRTNPVKNRGLYFVRNGRQDFVRKWRQDLLAVAAQNSLLRRRSRSRRRRRRWAGIRSHDLDADLLVGVGHLGHVGGIQTSSICFLLVQRDSFKATCSFFRQFTLDRS